MTRFFSFIAGSFLLAFSPTTSEAARVSNDPSLNPLVDHKVNLDCISREESLSGFRVELRQVNDQFFMNYQDLSYSPVVTMLVRVFQDENLLVEFEVDGTRRSTNRVFFTLNDAPIEFSLNVTNLPEGAGTLMLEHVQGLPRTGFFTTRVSCLMTPQDGVGDD